MDSLLRDMVAVSEAAGARLMAAYGHPELTVRQKADDSPVTSADKASHHCIVDRLRALADWPVLSEEGPIPPWEERRHWTRYWLVDPLDGTREFIRESGDFAVHIALIEAGEVTGGVVHQPAHGLTYVGRPGQGAWCLRDGREEALTVRAVGDGLTVLGSRHRRGRDWPALLERLRRERPVTEAHVGGSLKYCRIAAGRADLYPCLVPVCEWDTAAPQAVLEGAGGLVRCFTHKRLLYNQKQDLRQGCFYAAGDRDFPWAAVLTPPEKD